MTQEMTTPAWMVAPGTAQALPAPTGKKRRESALRKTLVGISRAMRETVFTEKIANRPGLLQQLDPRVKAVSLLGLLVVASLLRHWYVLLILYALTILMALASGIPLRFFVRRVWLFVPAFAAIIALPSIFNVVRPGDPLWTIWEFGGEVTLGPWSLGDSLAVTSQGVKGVAVFIIRVTTSVSLGVLLALTTRWTDLLKALRVFLVPRLFIFILSLTYRYIFLLLGMTAEMFTARTSRMVGPSTPAGDRRFMASNMGTLLGKSHAFSEEVFAAMTSRGFDGEPVTSHSFRMRGADWLWLATAAGSAALFIGGDRLIG